jgi:hypothetical protein
VEKTTLKSLIDQRKSIREISVIVGKSPTTVRYWLNKYNLKTDPYNPTDQCIFCGKDIYRKNKKYCNSKCQQAYQWEQRKKKIKESGKIEGVVTGKRYLKETRGDKCEICGLDEWNKKPISRVMDHINGNSSNDDLINLRLVCPNCDSQLPTYKSRNRGNGRHSRRQRYAEGNSY